MYAYVYLYTPCLVTVTDFNKKNPAIATMCRRISSN